MTIPLKKIKERLWENIMWVIAILAIAVFFILFFWDELGLPACQKAETVVAAAILITGLIFSLLNYKISYDQFFKSLFMEFNSRFDNMNEALNAIRDGKYDNERIEEKKKTEEEVIVDYLNLCAEEYLWYSKGRIDFKVWDSWVKGMVYYLHTEPFEATVRKQKTERESYYGLFDELEDKIEAAREEVRKNTKG